MEGTHSGFGYMATIWTAVAVHESPAVAGLGRRYFILDNNSNTMTTMSKGYGMARSMRLVKRIKRIKNNGTYTATNEIAWCPGYIEGYSNQNSTTAIAATLTEWGIKIWGTQGNIIVESRSENTQIDIYTINGVKIKTITGTPGTMQIPVKTGLYIVRVNGIGKKVVVTQ